MAREMVEQLEFGRETISYIVETTINNLPDESIATVISFTTPRDACHIATLSTTFNNVVGNSDIVWDRFLPPNYREIVLRASNVDHVHLLDTLSKKDLYMYLADNSLLLDQGLMLGITWGERPSYWHLLVRHVIPRLRFEIKGGITTSMLSPNTRYAAYLVFDVTNRSIWDIYDFPIEVTIETSGGEVVTGMACLDPCRREGGEGPEGNNVKLSKKRIDGWVEVEIGEFYTREEDEQVTFSLMEIENGFAKGSLVVQGIEIRPKIE
uniref:F-box domain-containing protein n=1 Tax=Chenopodium quinoa TaxID=63459 RepID=A0A803LPA0_CHEQI